MNEFKRILIIKFRHHGDVLLTSPLFSILREQYPNAQIDALVFAETQEMLSLHPAIDNLYVVDKKWKKRGALFQIKQELSLIKTLRKQRYDLVLHLTESMRGLWIALLSRCRQAITFANPRRDNIRLWKSVFTRRVPRVALRHTVELHIDTLRVLGIQPEPEQRKLVIVSGEEADRALADKLQLQGIDAAMPYIVVHPTSRWFFKCWRPEHIAEVINQLADRGHKLVLSASPDSEEMDMIADIKSRLRHSVADLSGQLTLKQLSSLIKNARLLIGVDSVPMHIAAATQTPVVALFGPSGDKEWGPWMVKSRVIVSQDHPCRPCGKDGCGGSKVSDCLQQIPVSQVMFAVDSLLDEDTA